MDVFQIRNHLVSGGREYAEGLVTVRVERFVESARARVVEESGGVRFLQPLRVRTRCVDLSVPVPAEGLASCRSSYAAGART